MKKILFFYIAALSSTWSTAQDWSTKLYVEDFPYVQVFDTSIRYLTANNVIGEPYKFYSLQEIYLLPNGNTLTINAYRDSLIYTSELDSSGYLVQGGEMKIDYAQAISKQYECSDQNGEDSTCYQIYYPLVKSGIWNEVLMINNLYLLSENINGVINEQNMFFQLDALYYKRGMITPISRFHYDTMSKQYSFKFPGKRKMQNLIEGQWYHPCIIGYAFKENTFIFLRSKNKCTPDLGYTESFFDPTGNYRGKRRLSCGTGATEQDFRPTSTWELTHDNKLIFLDVTWTILYLDEEIIILKYEE